jgi:hypothetical protein
LEGGKARRVISKAVLQAWNLHMKPMKSIAPETLAEKAQGLPIISPPLLRQVL